MSKRTGSRLDAAWWTAWVVGATTLGLLGGPSGIAATATYDLSADFSLAANPTPKGWQYSQQLEQLGGGGGLLREQGCLYSVKEPLEPPHELGLGDSQLRFGGDATRKGWRHASELLDEVG